MQSTQQQKGFSIVEVLIVLVILTILVAALTPAYRNYQIRSNRSDAIKSILAIQIAEEKYRITNMSYGDLAAVWPGTTNSYNNYYQMSITNNTASAYTITATALSAQADDTGCTTMTLTNTNGTTTKSPSNCWQ
ncbi:MAG: Pilus assembly protein [uncultured bacterium]|nr:MAG: Pilus assembly protein [uncultured bacterium]